MGLQEFLRKVREKEANKIRIAEIEIKDIGKVEFTRPSDKDVNTYFEEITKTGNVDMENSGANPIKDLDFEKMVDASKKLIYNCCKVLQAKETREEYKHLEPYDIPVEIFGSLDTVDLASKILTVFKIVEEKKKDKEIIKNSSEVVGDMENSTGSPTTSNVGTN